MLLPPFGIYDIFVVGSVDYDKGVSRVSVEKDWKVSEVVVRLLWLNNWDDVDAVLNCWVGRFAKKKNADLQILGAAERRKVALWHLRHFCDGNCGKQRTAGGTEMSQKAATARGNFSDSALPQCSKRTFTNFL
ncbi:hypothetical protein KFK09_016902 [Dendrobium nobile]|uniref:Uncharacterized protein n=1 Tax=Dendrobium nobile TaxID=94219 RepID=A0A8T3B0Q3_DENNO|nr:hypothetical protein KFK09_016902 [Dendrobium nobile]